MLESPLFDKSLDDVGPAKPLPCRNRSFFRLQLRPWFVGASLIGFAVYFRAYFKDDFQFSRTGVVYFALVELMLCATGLGLSLISLVKAPTSYGIRGMLLAIWMAGVVVVLGSCVGDLPS